MHQMSNSNAHPYRSNKEYHEGPAEIWRFRRPVPCRRLPDLIVLSLALYDRLKSGAPALMQVATAIGIIWAGSLIASGMVANAGIAPVVVLYAKDPAQAAFAWQRIESVANGLGNGNGEILGGLWTLLVSLAALRTGGLPKGLNSVNIG
jgi:hypothetical protein